MPSDSPLSSPRPGAPEPTAMEQLADLLKDTDVRIAIGLRQQGKFERVAQMVRDGAGWTEIGRTIGWEPKAAAEWFGRELLNEYDKLAPAAPSRGAQAPPDRQKVRDALACCFSDSEWDKQTWRIVAQAFDEAWPEVPADAQDERKP